ncbi:type I 3-dehydroquinate dehydratase [Candidatus Magnetominusculus dajiuhuensis]|uniref:type I 3-dehydroquinate dehydratase n=1 Tax=Candidatus Magnetominusculus dajiuhuensis TaxID=3137712 RepID=UPI003B42CD57
MPQIKIGSLTLGPRPLIAVPLTDMDVSSVETLQTADIAELRVDMFSDLHLPHIIDIFKTFKNKFPDVPVIATCRSKEEGGAAAITDALRVEIFTHIIDLTDAVDIEVESDISAEISTLTSKHSKTLITSYHNFSQTPDEKKLEEVYEQGRQIGARIVKIAVTPNNMTDIKRLTEFTLNHRPVVTISMGAMGMASRIFLPLVGSLFTFASLETVTAPGQMSIVEVRKFYQAF